jgi:hypothetical protein
MTFDTTVRTSGKTTVFTLCLIYLSWLYSSDAVSRDSFAQLIKQHDRSRRDVGIPSIGG